MEPHLLLKRILPLKGIEVGTTRSASTGLTNWATRASHLHAVNGKLQDGSINFGSVFWLPYLFGYKTGFSLSRMTRNN